MTNTNQPTWAGIRDVIQNRILNREYAPGDKLPKDEELAESFSCARTTVQRAMRDLSDKGMVERRRKGGTRVRSHPVTRATFEIPITRLEVEGKGSSYGYQLVQKSIATPPLNVLANFNMQTSEELLHVQAVHLADNRPYIFEDRWISLATTPEINEVDLASESANEWLVRHKPYDRCELRIYAQKSTEQHSELLGIAVGEALLVIERTTWIDDQPITSVKAITRPDYQMLAQAM